MSQPEESTDPQHPRQPAPDNHAPFQPGSAARGAGDGASRFIGASRQPSRQEMPAELAGGSDVKKRGWHPLRALVAALIAIAMILAGVIVSVAVLRGPQVKADAPLDPATPATSQSGEETPGESGLGLGSGGATAPGEHAAVPGLEGTTFTIPLELAQFEDSADSGGGGGDAGDATGGAVVIDVTGVGRLDPWQDDGVYGYYPWLTDGYLHTVIEGTVTNVSDGRVDLGDELQAFVRTSTGNHVRAEIVIVDQDPYGYPRVKAGEDALVAFVFPTADSEDPEALGIAVGRNWYDAAAWLELDGVATVDP